MLAREYNPSHCVYRKATPLSARVIWTLYSNKRRSNSHLLVTVHQVNPHFKHYIIMQLSPFQNSPTAQSDENPLSLSHESSNPLWIIYFTQWGWQSKTPLPSFKRSFILRLTLENRADSNITQLHEHIPRLYFAISICTALLWRCFPSRTYCYYSKMGAEISHLFISCLGPHMFGLYSMSNY